MRNPLRSAGPTTWAVGLLFTVLLACSSARVTQVDVQSYEGATAKTRDAVFNDITAIFIERGFDVKTSARESGLITTEWKKVASAGDKPPFDYSLQIRTTVNTTPSGGAVIRLSPFVRAQNRTNAAAFSDYELGFYRGEPKNIRRIASMREVGWRTKANVEFNNVLADIAARLGITMDQMRQNVTETEINATDATPPAPVPTPAPAP